MLKEDSWNVWMNKEYYNEELLKEMRNYYKLLFDKLNIDTQNKSAIEIGAGHGITTEVFIPLFKKFTATEPNKFLYDELEKLKNKYDTLLTINTSCEKLQEVNKKLSFIIFTYSFLFTNKQECINVCNKILKRDGYLLILDPFRPLKLDDNFE